MTLKEYFKKINKKYIYEFYTRLNKEPKEYSKITRDDIYNNIISLYKEDPELILKLCTIEEINILKQLIKSEKMEKHHGYVEYIIFDDLKNNFLVIEDDGYYIPDDLLNYVKMALNMYDEDSYTLREVTDGLFLGLIRIYNVLTLEEFNDLLKDYYLNMSATELKKYITESPKLKDLVGIVKYKKKEYVISLEYCYYKDIIGLQRKEIILKKYSLESILSISKYKIDLFNEHIFRFLNFLEVHLEPIYIDVFLKKIIIYMGLDINDDEVLRNVTENIEELYQALIGVLDHLPVWIYKGNSINSLNNNIKLPNKNDPCFCGSGKKFKRCCGK